MHVHRLVPYLAIQAAVIAESHVLPAHAVPADLVCRYNVETRDIYDYTDHVMNIESNVGFRPFQLKPLALLHTDLAEVILLDADSTPLRDPSFLFADKRYAETGTLFWPDYWKTAEANPIWNVLNIPYQDSWEQESGQMVVNKKHAWKAINLCVRLQNSLYYSLLNGDKDTFRFAWKASKVPYVMNSFWPAAIGMKRESVSSGKGFCGHTMGQHDFDGRLLFVHHNQIKLDSLMYPGMNFGLVQNAQVQHKRSRVS